MMQIVNISEKLNKIPDYWNPRIVGELNGQQVKLAKLKGDFVWHKHEQEDELFWVVSGTLQIAFRDRTITLQPNEFVIVPRGVEHKPFAAEEVSVLLFEPISTLNTGDVSSDLTKDHLERL
jgi:mannose-6-phosphate isomerase-like protein (cupin superfamily)